MAGATALAAVTAGLTATPALGPGVGTAGAAAAGGFTPTTHPTPKEPDGRWTTARVLRGTALRARPGGRVVDRLRPRTEFGSKRVLSVVRRRGAWLGVLAPQLPNRRVGWVRKADVRLGATDLWVRIDRSRRTLALIDGMRVLRRFPVAVGRPGNPTPLGRFAVTDKLHVAAGSPYGCCAVALTGHQVHLPPNWPGGDRLAVHGTSDRSSIGRAASLGCLRAGSGGLRLMMRRLPLGAPVFVGR
jgi:lipoprotein-anchoring transpeptidase ErfK/SrfK